MIFYDRPKLNELLSSFSELVGANISIYGENFEGAYVENQNDHSFCAKYLRAMSSTCSCSDAEALKKSYTSKKPFFYKCHFGYFEIMLYYELDKDTHFNVCVGPFREEKIDDEIIDKIKNICTRLNKDFDEALDNFYKTPIFNEIKYKSIVNIIDALMKYAIDNKYINIKGSFLVDELDPYLKKNLNKNITVSLVTKEFFLTSKQLETEVKRLSGLSPKKYILRYKVNAAKDMLINSTKSLQIISYDVGFEDYNYFIKVFKSITNDTPFKYRQKFSSKSFIETK